MLTIREAVPWSPRTIVRIIYAQSFSTSPIPEYRSLSASEREHQVQSRSTFQLALLTCFVVPTIEAGQQRPNKDVHLEVSCSMTDSCFPPKMSLCCTGGIPSFSSTRSLIRDTWTH